MKTKRIALRFVQLLVAGYLCIVFTIVVCQRSLIYSPVAEGAHIPSEYGAKFEEIVIPAGVGPARKGWFVHDSSRPARPILVYCQGNGGGLSVRAKVAALFDSIGLDVVMLSYRGFGNSGYGEITPTEQHIYEDAQAAYEFAKSRVAEKQILVWGHSLGAAVAAHLAAANHPAGVILESPFKSIESMIPVRYPWLIIPSFLVFDKFPTIEYVKSLNAPLLMLVAQNDTIIPREYGAEVFKAANEPKKFIPLVGINHNELPDAFETYRNQIGEFIFGVLSQS